MRKELYINSKLVELDSNTKIDLQFKSFLFSGISTLTAPRSWTVSLPKTASNLALIEGASAGDSDTDFPYNNYVVDYYQEGARVINQGKAVLIKITDRIEFVFTFGKAYDAIAAMEDTNLRDLTEDSTDWLYWNRYISTDETITNFGWANWYSFTNQDKTYDAEVGHDDLPYSTLHPIVLINYIMTKIQAFFGITFIGISSFLTSCAIPLKDMDGVSVILPSSTANSATTIAGTEYSTRVPFSTGTFDSFTLETWYLKKTNIQVKREQKLYITELNFSVAIDNEDIDPASEIQDCRIYIFDINGVSRDVATAIRTIEPLTGGGTGYFYRFTNISFTFEETDSYFCFYLPSHLDIGVPGFTLDVILENTSLSFKSSAVSAYYSASSSGGFFPIIPNLPDMTCSEFVFNAMQLAGVFPSVDDEVGDTITFYPSTVLYYNIEDAKDWSKKLVKTMPRMNEVSDVAFTFGDYAQKNILKYADDDTNTLETYSYLTVSNANLEKESNLVELSFAAGKRFEDTNKIVDYPLYDISIDGTTLTKTDITQDNDIIGKIQIVSGTNYLKFTDDLKWGNIKLGINYYSYQSLINKPRYIRENFYLKPSDIENLQLQVPIYLSQYGKYYAIMLLQYKEDEFSECELLEIKNV